MLGRSYRIAIAASLCVMASAGTAAAHPLGNFSINHQTRVQISADRVDLLYILDQAEILTFQERDLSAAETLQRKQREVRESLWLIVDGKRVQPRPRGKARISFPRGAGGLQITRVEVPLTHRAPARNVIVRDLTFLGRVGWSDIVAVPGRGTAVRTAASTSDPTQGLRSYRGITLQDVPDQRIAAFRVRPGRGTVRAVRPTPGPPPQPAQSRDNSSDTGRDSGDEFTGLFEDAAAGEGLFVVILMAAFGWGALHALSPGHGKAMVAAYLVGTRGRPRHALALGGIVTVTHTIGVFALGLVTLLLSSYILPEDLFPWLNLAAGLLIVAVGLAVLNSRVRWARRRRHPDSHAHGHGHDRDHDHEHALDPTWKGLTGMGVSAGLIPCPTALVVLLAAISQQEVGLGLVLIVAFSLGLAATIVSLGLVVVSARSAASVLGDRLGVPTALMSALPLLSTLVILGVGIALTASAVPDLP